MTPRSTSRAEVAAAALLCVLWWGFAVLGTSGAQPFTPDVAHTAVVARNLLNGRGNTIDWVPVHFGLRDQVRGVPEWHGLLRAPLLAALFATSGARDEIIRLPGLAFTAATALVAFLFARSVFGGRAGWLACLLALGSRGLFHWGLLGTDDSGFAFFFLLTLFLAYLSLERDTRFLPWAGIAGALALLEKQTGLYLAGVFLGVLWLGRGRGTMRRSVAWLFVPFAVALGAYLLRNYAAHGGIGFRLGPLNWLFKAEGVRALYALYPQPPGLGEVLASLGPERIVAIVAAQLRSFLEAVFLPGGGTLGSLSLLALGIPSLALHARSRPTFFWLGALSIAGAVAFVCGLYSFEERYFLMLLPLAGIAIDGAIAAAWRAPRPGWRRVLRPAAALAAAVVVAEAAFAAERMVWAGRRYGDHRRTCPAAIAWIRENVPEDDVILTTNPWWTSWMTERPSVMLPTGPRGAVGRVAMHYRARWIFLPPNTLRRPRSVMRSLRFAGRFVPKLVLVDRRCFLYSLRPGPVPAKRVRTAP